MDCYKKLSLLLLKSVGRKIRPIARFISLSSFGLIIPQLAFAAPSSTISLNVIQAFFLGAALPTLLYLFWYLVISKADSIQTPKLSPEEYYHYTHDRTTHLPTAQHALKQFEKALKSSKDSRMAAVVFKPINFRQVNTVLGHHNSDILLLQLAYCLQKNLMNNQSLLSFDNSPDPIRLARLQGLDFLVVFDLTTTNHEAKHVIDNLCSQLAKAVPEAMSFKSFSLNFELAFGVAISDGYGNHDNSVNEIVSHATDALLSAESKDKTLEYFDYSAVIYTEQQLALMESLRKDILDKSLRWYLQPQVNVEDNTIIGFELKVHWYHDEEQALELVDFIDLAEHSGEVYRLTRQMFKQAFKALFTLHKTGVYQRVSVSLTSKNLLEPDLVDYVARQMDNFNIPGKYLMIELDEQVLLSAGQRAKETIDQLKSLDVAISISNFSGSYESLRYLRKMAIHQVKINCEQLDSHEQHRADKAIINALITLTRSMKLPLIGTNIDRHESVQDYIAMGGSLVQGNIISQGVVPDELDVWLRKWFEQHPGTKPVVNNY